MGSRDLQPLQIASTPPPLVPAGTPECMYASARLLGSRIIHIQHGPVPKEIPVLVFAEDRLEASEFSDTCELFDLCCCGDQKLLKQNPTQAPQPTHDTLGHLRRRERETSRGVFLRSCASAHVTGFPAALVSFLDKPTVADFFLIVMKLAGKLLSLSLSELFFLSLGRDKTSLSLSELFSLWAGTPMVIMGMTL